LRFCSRSGRQGICRWEIISSWEVCIFHLEECRMMSMMSIHWLHNSGSHPLGISRCLVGKSGSRLGKVPLSIECSRVSIVDMFYSNSSRILSCIGCIHIGWIERSFEWFRWSWMGCRVLWLIDSRFGIRCIVHWSCSFGRRGWV
jgi:hypothetical protein